MVKKKTPEQEVKDLCVDIRREIEHWEYLNEYGGQDPFWPDGVNMNLTRNHIIYDKHKIMEICVEQDIPLPDEYYLPTPPEVDDYYMAHLRDKKRVERIAFGHPGQITTKRNKYNKEQLTLF